MFKNRTTYHLEVVIENFHLYPKQILMSAKRELDRRYRKRTIELQRQREREAYEKKFGKK